MKNFWIAFLGAIVIFLLVELRHRQEMFDLLQEHRELSNKYIKLLKSDEYLKIK